MYRTCSSQTDCMNGDDFVGYVSCTSNFCVMGGVLNKAAWSGGDNKLIMLFMKRQ